MKLNDQQELAANHKDGPCLCTAVPGSGKTRVIVERTHRLIDSGISPHSILSITFTNKAAAEMKERVIKRIGEDFGKKLFISTFHRLCSTILRYHGHHLGYDNGMTILDSDEQVDLISQIARQKDFELTKPQIKQIAWKVNDSREKLETIGEMQDAFDKLDERYYSIAEDYIKKLRSSNVIDFTGLLSEAHRLLVEHPQVVEAAQKRWKYFMVDEVQDTNLVQFRIVEILANHTKNIFVVGDVDQCQPPGTKVLTTEHGEVNIEDLDPEVHKLVSFSTRTSAVLGRRNGLSFKKAARRSHGYLHTIKTADKTTRCTPNHKWTVKLKKDVADKHLVYLMRSGDYWRVGHTSAFRSYGPKSKGAFGPIMLARQEQADAVWVLKVCDSSNEAQLWEQITSCKYGIPTICFTSGKYMMQNLPKLYAEIVPVEYRVKQCMEKYGLWMDQPIWEKRCEYSPDFGRRIPFKVHASNLIPDLMQIPVPTLGKEFVWSDFAMSRDEYYEGQVYSLDVEKHEHYIADGIVTHNSIYGWRGARLENIRDFQKKFANTQVISLGKNYRSTPQIIAVADRLIRHNPDRIEVEFSTDNPSGSPVSCKLHTNNLKESEDVAKTIKHMVASGKHQYKDFAVFYRLNSMSRAAEMAMISNGISHTVIGNFSFFDRKEVKDCMAMLRFIVNPKDGLAFHRFANKPKRHLGDTTVGKIEMYAEQNNVDLMQAMKDMPTTAKAVKQGLEELVKALSFDSTTMGIGEVLNKIVTNIKYKEYLDEDADSAVDRWDNVQELIRDAARYSAENGPGIAKYLEQVALITSSDKTADGNAVSLMSLHASKGLEFPVVFMLGVEQNILPHKRAVDEREDGLDEERRLCYVGFTRAKQLLYVNHCQARQEGFGKISYKRSMPSQFLYESGLAKKPEPVVERRDYLTSEGY